MESKFVHEGAKLAISQGQAYSTLTEYPHTLPDALIRAAEYASDKGIVHVKADGSEVYQSYPDLLQDAEKVLAGLRAQGLQTQDKVMIEIKNSIAFLAVFWGCLLGGMIPVPLHVPSAFDPDGQEMLRTKKVWQLLEEPLLIVDRFMEPQYLKLQDSPLFTRLRVASAEFLLEHAPDSHHHVADPQEVAFLQFSSGSTGLPKGVQLTHDNLRHNICSMAEATRDQADDVFVSWMPYHHDMGLIGFHLRPLFVLAKQVKLSHDTFVRRPELLLLKLTEHRGTITGSPNFGLEWMTTKVKEGTLSKMDLSSVRCLFNGAEPISVTTAQKFCEHFARCGFRAEAMWYAYGMAEACLAVALASEGPTDLYHEVDQLLLTTHGIVQTSAKPEAMRLLIANEGQPVPGMEVRIVNEQDEVVQEGQVGHIQIKGPNVTQGYYHNEEANRDLFCDGYLRTGDLGFLLDGRLVVTGRSKDVLFVNGQNFFAHDIEQHLIHTLGLPSQSIVACGIQNPESGHEQAYLFIKSKKKWDELLPLYQKIKSTMALSFGVSIEAVIQVASIPKTTSGKVERYKLRDQLLAGDFDELLAELRIESDRFMKQRKIVLPRTEMERRLHRFWAEILHIPPENISIDDNFAELGGESLKLLEILQELEKQLGDERVNLEVLFEYRTIELLSNYLAEATNEGLEVAVDQEETEQLIAAGPHQSEYDLSHGQRALWFIQQMDANNVAYNEHYRLHLRGRLDVARLRWAIAEVVRRHAILRTVFVEREGVPKQVILNQIPVELPLVDLSSNTDEEKERQLQAHFVRELQTPYDLSQAPLFRFRLFRLGDAEYQLYFFAHHIIIDATSIGLLLEELNIIYAAELNDEEHNLRELSVQFVDVTMWQQEQRKKPEFALVEKYWLEQMHKPLPILDVPTDFARPAVQTYQGRVLNVSFDKELAEGLKAFCKAHNVSLYMLMLSAYVVWLDGVTGETDLIVGAPMAGRLAKETHQMIGYFVNTMPIRVSMAEVNAFGDLLSQVKSRVLEALARQDYPFDLLVEKVNPERDLSRPVLFNTMFNMLTIPSVQWPGVAVETLPNGKVTCSVDMSWVVWEQDEQLHLDVEFNTDLFRYETVSKFVEQYKKLLAFVTDENTMISQMDLLTDADRAIYAQINDTAVPYDLNQLLFTPFVKQAQAHPERIALTYGGESMTYGELDARSNQIAHFLRGQGVQPNQTVAVFMERSLEMLVSLYGILKSGAAYVPIDPEYPADRVQYMLVDSGSKLLLSKLAYASELQALADESVSWQAVLFLDNHTSQANALGKVASYSWLDVSRYSKEQPEVINAPTDLAYLLYTSGSTGRPKGVMIPHRAVVNRLMWHQDTFQASSDDVVLQRTSHCFDVSVTEFFWPLQNGARLSILSNQGVTDVDRLLAHLAREQVTYMQFVPSLLHVIVSHLHHLPTAKRPKLSLRNLVVSGEALPAKSVNRWFEMYPTGSRITNLCGPTEAAIDVTCASFDQPVELVPIGKPIANTQCYIVNAHQQLCPVGVVGELYLGGVQLADGYHNKPEQTEAAFVPNFLPGTPGNRLYRTGDLARLLPDGNIEYVGRIDHQVKVRGFRIELAEIEETLTKHPDVENAIVLANRMSDGNNMLVGFYTTKQKTLAAAELQRFLGHTLPDYMVPPRLQQIDEMPLSPNGKTDRKALALLAAAGDDARGQHYEAPTAGLEAQLAQIWSDVLKRERIGRQDNFFEMGGHSLLLMQVQSRIRGLLQIEVGIEGLFSHPTVAKLSTHLEEKRASSAPNIAALKTETKKQEHYALSSGQKQLWFLHKLNPNSTVYHVPTSIEYREPLDVDAFEKALQYLVMRHGAFRTVFLEVNGEPRQIVKQESDFRLLMHDLTALPFEVQSLMTNELIAEMESQPFDLQNGPLMRAMLFSFGEPHYRLYLNQHHIITDGWSQNLFFAELAEVYRAFCQGKQPSLPELPLQYVDYAEWQQEELAKGTYEQEAAYWMETLAKPLPVLDLPSDFVRPSEQSFEGDALFAEVPAALVEQLRRVSREEDVSMFMLTMAAYVLTLQQLTQGQDIVVGTPISLRNQESLEGLIGFFVNTLAIRTRFEDIQTPHDLLQQVKRQCIDAFAHSSYPFDLLVEKINPERDSGRFPIFSTLFSYQNQVTHGSLDAKTNLETETHQVSRYDLTLMVFEETEDRLQVGLEFSAHLFKRETVERFATRYLKALETFVHNRFESLSTMNLLTADEEKLYEDLNHPDVYPVLENTVTEQFEEWVESNPNDPAVSDQQSVMTYQELNERANQVAHFLQGQGLQQQQIVGILMERSVNFVVALLGVLKAGGGYLPIDADTPQERIDYMLADSGAVFVLTSQAMKEKANAVGARNAICFDELPADLSTENLPYVRRTDDLAYVIYTSGSTGRPKGVLISDIGLVNIMHHWQTHWGGETQEVILQFATVAFDACVFEVFSALLTGSRCHIMDGEERQSLSAYVDTVKRVGATVMMFTTSFFNQLGLHATEEDVQKLATVRQIFVWGEALQANMVRTWQKKFGNRMVILNGYGPTEVTIMTTGQLVTAEPDPDQRVIPLGRPVSHYEVYVLNEHMQKCPVLVPGELYIGGIGLMKGYLNLPERMAEVLVPNPFSTTPGAKLYRSGDIVRLLPDGTLDFLGRKDTQIKVRGFRVEIGEIEEVLLQHPQVQSAAVISKQGTDGTHLLFGFYTSTDLQIDSETVRKFLQKKLPDYMVPSRLICLEELPFNRNKKIDRLALGKMDLQTINTRTARPVTEWQQKILEIWAEALQVEPDAIGIHDNFFEIGGHSLLMAKVQALLKQHLGLEVKITELFAHPTVKALTEALYLSEQTQEKQAKSEKPLLTTHNEQEAVAIIGMGLRFPDASTPEEFWQNLRDGKESVREVPLEELDVKPRAEELDRLVRFGGFLDQIDQFDPTIFGMTDREALLMDPQQRLFLECAWEAFEDAGYNVLDMEEPVNVYAGIANTEYGKDYAKAGNLSDAFQGMLLAQPNFLATRVAYLLNLKGESMVLNTACSTSLVTVHHACLALLNGLTDYALAGGVSVTVPYKTGFVYEPGFIMSPDGHCRAFDKGANGTARGSGAGVILLKRLSDAKRDGDPIYAVIKGTATNNDGHHKVGFSAPSQQGQAKVIAKAQALAGVAPDQISYVETHGSGTPLGDSIELAALNEVFGAKTKRKNFCAIGSVKTNIGHADTAAGIASLIKTALAMKHGEIPPSLNFDEPNPELDLSSSPFYVNTELRPWVAEGQPRRAGVSSFGIGGTNAHLILEDASAVEEVDLQTEEHSPHLFLLSGKTEQAVREAAGKLASHLIKHRDQSLADLSYTLQVGRVHHDHRLALVAVDRDELLQKCIAAADSKELANFSQGQYRFRSAQTTNAVTPIDGLEVQVDSHNAWTWQDALHLVQEQERMRKESAKQEVILVIHARNKQAMTYVRHYGRDISILGANGPQQVIVSVKKDVADKLEQELAREQILCKRLESKAGGHSHHSERQSVMEFLGLLFVEGASIDWETVPAEKPRRRVHAPTYPFQRKSYWLQPAPVSEPILAYAEVSATAQAARLASAHFSTEQMIRQFWEELLGVTELQPNDNFFHLGAGSLNLIQIQSRINKTWGLQLQLAELFDHLTFEDMVAYVDFLRSDELVEEETDEQEEENGPIPRAPKQERYSMSHAQRRLYFLQKLDPESTAYTNFIGFALTGELDIDLFMKAYKTMFERHSVLRTLFIEVDGVAYQEIKPQVEIDFTYEDLSSLVPEERASQIRQRMDQSLAKPFDLSKGPITRVLLLKSDHNEYHFQMFQHHIINDGWSMGVFSHELIHIYQSLVTGKGLPRKVASLQYVDYTHWQDEMLASGQWAEEEAYWLDTLYAPLPLLHLPTDYPRPEMQTFNGDKVRLQIGQEVMGPLWKRMTQEGVSMFMLILAAYVVLLNRYTEEEDIIVGTPVLGRPQEAFENMLGIFANSVAIRAQLQGVKSLSDVLQLIKEQTLDAMQHQMYPFDLLIDKLQLERDMSRSPLFSTMFVFNTAAEQMMDEQVAEGLTIGETKYPVEVTTSKFDLSLMVMSVNSEQLEVDFEYNTDLFKRETIERMGESFVKVLRAFGNQLRKPLSALDVLPEQDRALYEQLNNTEQELPNKDRTLQELFYEQADKRPDQIAVSDLQTQMTYRELNERSNQVARLLREQGVSANQIVGLFVGRNVNFAVAVLAVLKCGATYLPLDPTDSEERIRFMLEDSQANLVLIDDLQASDALPSGSYATICLNDVPEEIEKENLEVTNSAQDAAYIIFTSGSTGRPKGALLSHNNVVNLVEHKQEGFSCTEQEVMLLFSSFSFDASVLHLFGGLLKGGRVHVLSNEARQSIESFADEVAMSGGTCVLLPTVFFNQLSRYLSEQDFEEKLATLRCIAVGGEALQASVVRTWQQRFGDRIAVFNGYGPTETTVFVSLNPLKEKVSETMAVVPIGKPMTNTQVYVLNPHLQICPIHVVGELYIGGAGVGLGYRNRPETTAEAFLPNPFSKTPGAKLYKTGDFVRLLPDGTLDYVGRKDSQVKIRGYRVEIGEVEDVLSRHPQIRDAVVIAKKWQDQTQLVAFYTCDANEALKEGDLREWAASRLAPYMVPVSFCQLEEMPLNSTGKVDRKRLPDAAWQESTIEVSAPRTELEQRILEVWEQCISHSTLGVHDNFFHIGGDSIIAMQVVARMNQAGLAVKTRDLLQHQTIAELARVVEAKRADSKQNETMEENQPLVGEVRFAPVQQWMFEQKGLDHEFYPLPIVLDVQRPINVKKAEQALQMLVDHHDMLRATYVTEWDRVRQILVHPDEAQVHLEYFDLSMQPEEQQAETIEQIDYELKKSMRLNGRFLSRQALIRLNETSYRLIWVLHHLQVDLVSLRILIHEFTELYERLEKGEQPRLPGKTTSYREWVETCRTYIRSDQGERVAKYWQPILEQIRQQDVQIPIDFPDGENDVAHQQVVCLDLNESATETLLTGVHAVHGTSIKEILLTATLRAVAKWSGKQQVLLEVEGHGRVSLHEEDSMDLTRTVGWFTGMYPLYATVDAAKPLGEQIEDVRDQLLEIPNGGASFGMLRYLHSEKETHDLFAGYRQPEIMYNFFGQYDNVEFSGWKVSEQVGPLQDPQSEKARMRLAKLMIEGHIEKQCLQMRFYYSDQLHREETVVRLAELFEQEVKAIIQWCTR